MTVDDLIHQLDQMPADAQVVISTEHDGDIEDFTLTLSVDGERLVLESDS
jgi:hypothetical protein